MEHILNTRAMGFTPDRFFARQFWDQISGLSTNRLPGSSVGRRLVPLSRLFTGGRIVMITVGKKPSAGGKAVEYVYVIDGSTCCVVVCRRCGTSSRRWLCGFYVDFCCCCCCCVGLVFV